MLNLIVSNASDPLPPILHWHDLSALIECLDQAQLQLINGDLDPKAAFVLNEWCKATEFLVRLLNNRIGVRG